MRRFVLLLIVGVSTTGCLDRMGARGVADRIVGRQPRPDVPPVMLNEESPFRYPPALWAQRVQGNVTLRVLIDSTGNPLPDSTTIAESSGIAAFDSAALTGAKHLKFRPAQAHNVPVGVTLLLPVFFRHPDAPPLPGDSALKRIKRVPSPR